MLCYCVQNSAIAAVESLLAWIESQLLSRLVSTGAQLHRRPRRLLTSSDCTLLSDPEADTLTQSVLVSDTSVIGRPDEVVPADTKDFVINLIKVTLHCCTLACEL